MDDAHVVSCLALLALLPLSACRCNSPGTLEETGANLDTYTDPQHDSDTNDTSDTKDDTADAATWYADTDGDGYGDAKAPLTSTTQPPGYVEDATDCNDSDAAIHPGAKELCNAIDDDCDRAIDEGIIAHTWYVDSDGDGYGDPSVSLSNCAEPKGYVEEPGDCDDSRPDVSPAGKEVCQDGIDQDCSGADFGCRYAGIGTLGDVAIVELVGENATDWAGGSIADAGDVDGDGFDDILVGASYSDAGGSSSGVAYLLYGPVTADRDLSLAEARLVGAEAGDHAGSSVSGAGDVNGDGLADILVGATFGGTDETGTGAAYVVFGPVVGDLDLASADVSFWGEDAEDQVGSSVSEAGDVNDDGLADLVIGGPGVDGDYADVGAAYLVYGPISEDCFLSASDAKLLGEGMDGDAGGAVSAAGDVNGDGFADILVGDPGSVVISSGTAFLLLGPITADSDLSAAGVSLLGEYTGNDAGGCVSQAGDVNADGFADILVGARYNAEGGYRSGAAYLLYGPITEDRSLALADVKLVGEAASDYAGAVSGAGDLDQDGFADFLVGAPGSDLGGTGSGSTYLFYGPITGDRSLSLADAQFVGEHAGDAAGGVSSAGDVDGDGFGDILLGAYESGDGGGYSGAAYLVLSGGMP
jgi:hypothetical protein